MVSADRNAACCIPTDLETVVAAFVCVHLLINVYSISQMLCVVYAIRACLCMTGS